MFRPTIALTSLSIAVAFALGGCTQLKKTDVTADSEEAGTYDAYYGLPPSANAARAGSAAHHDRNSVNNRIQVNPKAPRTYVVQKGDTLWGIARKFLNTPYYWPAIWDKNQRIKNPHQIYPGDVLHFGYASGGGNVNKLMPRIRVVRSGAGEPISTLAPFIDWPRVMDEKKIHASPYILSSRDGRRLMTAGDEVFAKGIDSSQAGTRYAIYQPGEELRDSANDELLGHEVTYVGYARVSKADSVSTVELLEAKREIQPGDRLLPVGDHRAALRSPIVLPKIKVRGDVISLSDADYLGASCMLVAINRGKQHGIKAGYTLGVYEPGRIVSDSLRHLGQKDAKTKVAPTVQLPPEKVADLIVYEVNDKFSYGLVINSSREIQKVSKSVIRRF